MGAGQPAFFDNVETFEKKADEYFIYIQGEFKMVTIPADGDEKEHQEKEWIRPPEPPTITGLCLFMGFESRQSYYDYEKRSEFSYAVKKARLKVEHEYEKGLSTRQFPTGVIFALKNMGWSDKQEIKHEGLPNGPMQVEIVRSDDTEA